jgi:hypothetical protein
MAETMSVTDQVDAMARAAIPGCDHVRSNLESAVDGRFVGDVVDSWVAVGGDGVALRRWRSTLAMLEEIGR